eukprot:338106_1
MMSASVSLIDDILNVMDDTKQQQPNPTQTTERTYVKGLAGINAAVSHICTVGKHGMGLMYRGYSIQDLASKCTFEEVAYLLTRNKLPNRTELNTYVRKINSYYALSIELTKVLQQTPKTAHPIDVMKIACCFIGTNYPEHPNYGDKHNVFNLSETLDICDRLLALLPSAICYHYKYHFDKQRIDTKSSTNQEETISEHIIRCLHGNDASVKGYKTMIDAVNVSLICYAEHGLAASTFSARVTASTLSDAYSCICAAICSIKGPLHGGANEMAMKLIAGFKGDVDQAKDGIHKMLNQKQLIMGFGHRIYKKGDPRAPILKEKAKQLAKVSEFASPSYMDVSDVIEGIVLDEKGIYPNMDFPAAMLYHQCGIPEQLYTPIFVCSRLTGWFAHIIEQRQDNRLIRPSCIYKGPQLNKFIPIDQR